MISRAVRVPRIRLACRFGLITQRSTGLGFRPSPVHDGLARRLYTSELGNAGENKIEPFITDTDASKIKPKEEKLDEEPKVSPTGSEDATPAPNLPSSTDVDSEPTSSSEEPHLDEDPISKSEFDAKASPGDETFPEKPIDDAQAILDGALDESPSQPRLSRYVLPDLPDFPRSSSRHSPSSEQYALDDLLGESQKPGIEVSALPELEAQDVGDELMPLPKRRLYDRLMHDESLGVSTLGMPADAIIINNPNRTRIERPAPTVMEAKPIENTDLDWENLTPSEMTEPESEEIFKNIDELCPVSRILRLTDIDKLVNTLCDGFTVTQLREYHSVRKPQPRDHDMVKYEWIEQIVPWTSMNSVRLRGNDKATLAQKIVLDKWKIEVQEHADDLGKAFIWMDPDIFPFLTYGPNNIGRLLWELRRDFVVGEDEKLTLHTPKCRLNITAKKSTTYGILAHIDQAVQRMKSRVIDVAPLLPKTRSVALTPTERKELGRLTKTSITPVRHGSQEKLRVSWMPQPDEPPTETEDLADTVFRLIVGRVVPGADHGVLQCLPRSDDQDLVTGQPVPVQRQARAMSWRDKLQKWLRIVAPISKNSQNTPPLGLSSESAIPEEKCPRTGNVDATTATFGHILHQRASTSMKELYRKRRILAPLTPHPAAFSALKPDNDLPLKETTSIVMHLSPHFDSSKSPVTDPKKKLPADPAVYITIPVHPQADLDNFKIPDDVTAHIYVPWHNSDVLLPTEAVDVRLEHKRSHTLPITHPGMKSFFEKSQLNLREGQLRTPSQAMLRVPGSWLRGSGSGRMNTEKRDVLYDFRGTEIHQTVEMPWNGHTLRYSSIEAGQHGGQRQEITLQAGLPGENPVAFKDERRVGFLQLVEDMATGKCFSWSEGYKSIKSHQLEDFSYNLFEEDLPEDVIVDNEKFDSRGRVNRYRPATSGDSDKPDPRGRLNQHKSAIEMGNDRFDSRGRVGERESATKANGGKLEIRGCVNERTSGPKPKTGAPVEIFDDIEALFAAEGQTFELNPDNTPKPDEQQLDETKSDEKVSDEKYPDPIAKRKATDNLMSFLDEYASPKAFVSEDNKKLYGIDAAYHHKKSRTSVPKDTSPIDKLPDLPEFPEATPPKPNNNLPDLSELLEDKATPPKPQKEDVATKKEKTRKKVQSEYFATKEPVPKPKATPKKLATTRKAKDKPSKYTLPELQKPATMSDADAFAAQFARRATSENRGKDQNSVIGFFDTLPNEKPAKRQPAQKKKTSTSKRKQPTSSNSKRKRL
ncbi:mitochondrial inner-membrane-bound regulator-domain-containing protein [Fusarium oxysporum]|nr:mitochondrial inner-membrane-bound regulator-domain-containing protein [Fusarium oxysporum]